MKKLFTMVAFAATMLLGIVALSSCSKDDDDTPVVEPKPEEIHFALYSLKVVEDYFQYGDIEVTIVVDGKEDKVFSFLKDAAKKTATGDFAQMIGNKNIRVAEGSFSYKKNIKISAKYVLTEEGKKLVAAASDTDEVDIYLEEYFNHVGGIKEYPGTGVSALEDFLKVLNEYSTHSAN